jgi:Nucleoside diphosphate kinase
MHRIPVVLFLLSVFTDFAYTPPHSHLHFESMPNIKERTFIMVKPDGVQRALVGNIVGRFEARGFKLIAMKMVHATPQHLEKRDRLSLIFGGDAYQGFVL